MDQENTAHEEDELVYGVVEAALPNTHFRVVLDDPDEGDGDESVLAYLAGRMRRFRIRVLVGDRVGMVIDPYGGKARITTRLQMNDKQPQKQ